MRADDNLSLFDTIDPPATSEDWIPDTPPSLDGIDIVDFDTETNGLRWWEAHRPGGISVYAPDGAAALLQAGHQETTRVIIAAKRGHPQGPNASIGMSAVKVKD